MGTAVVVENNLVGRTTAAGEVQAFKQMVLADGTVTVACTWDAVDTVWAGARAMQHRIFVTTPESVLAPRQAATITYASSKRPGSAVAGDISHAKLAISINAPGNEQAALVGVVIDVASNAARPVSIDYVVVAAQNAAFFSVTYITAGGGAPVTTALGTTPTQRTH